MTEKNARRRPAPRVRAASSCSVPTSSRDRHDRAQHVGQRDRHRGEHQTQGRKEHHDARAQQRAAEPADARIGEDKCDTQDHWRHRNGNVEYRVERPLAPKLVTRDQHGRAHAHERVDRHRDGRDLDRQLQRVHGARLGQLIPERAEAVLERLVDHEHERQSKKDAEVRENDRAQRPATSGHYFILFAK